MEMKRVKGSEGMMKVAGAVVCLCLFFFFVSADQTIELQTNHGKFVGIEKEGAAIFRGIPYANPPIGKDRFKVVKALRYTERERVINATEFGDKCPHLAGLHFVTTGMSEDCLSLNIWAPLSVMREERRYPVMVFFHGGAFVLGSGADPYIDGIPYALRGALLVSVNYRLGPLGFLTYPYLTVEENGAEGNLGLIDQRQALIWIHHHIAAFGGDPSNVIIFGESAGAASVVFHLTGKNEEEETGEKLFHKAIVQSTVDESLLSTKCRNLADASTDFVKRAGCHYENNLKKSIECLMATPAFDLIETFGAFFEMRNLFWHTKSSALACFDDLFFFSPSLHSIANRHWNFDIPLIIGNTFDEGTMFTFMAFPFIPIDTSLYEGILQEVFPDQDYHKIEALYSLEALSSPQYALSTLIGDLYFQCFSRKLCNELVKYEEEAKVYRYIWKKVPEGGNQQLGAFHAVELPFVFDSRPGGFLFPSHFTPAESALSHQLLTYYLSFAYTGNPNPPSSPYIEWLPYTLLDKSILVFDDTVHHVNDFKQHTCEFWDHNYTGKMEKKIVDELKRERWISRVLNANGFKMIRNYRIVLLLLGLIIFAIIYSLIKCCRRRPSPSPLKKTQ